ncbi:MAG: aminotransferase class I/II-fold pyridoxal phosphate-dependent enzyme [Clostridia bacterium]|nr:aminotransferase class I/II-fold pyridoxal phosphate-dependent enzyme [Clostridia bacterium]
MIDYSKILSQKIQNVKPSGIRKFFDLLNGADDIVGLTVGQPDFPTPRHISEQAIRSIEEGKTYYTANSGLAELREEIAAYLNRRFDLKYEPSNEIIVTVGGSEAIDASLRSLINPGDEVILPQPSFVCYAPIIELCGGKVVEINTRVENSFKLTAQELKSAITEKTKLLILPFPNNPTGAIMTKEELEEIAAILRPTNIAILSDEIYAELTYGRRHVSIATLDGMRERTVIASGFSKAYAMTGWRLGYVAAPKEIAEQMYKIHQYGIMCAPTASQFAGVQALRCGDDDIEYMKAQYNRRRVMLLDGLHALGFECFEPEGAFYMFPRVTDGTESCDSFCHRLLNEGKVAIVPGTAFGDCGEGFARISYAYSVSHIEQALDRMEKFLKNNR